MADGDSAQGGSKMNIRQFLKKNAGRRLRVRPLPRVIAQGKIREAKDHLNYWATEIDADGKLKIRNLASGHSKVIGFDNVHEFREPDFLLLKAQLIYDGDNLLVEPLPTGYWGIPRK
jgi:hypothetical protein